MYFKKKNGITCITYYNYYKCYLCSKQTEYIGSLFPACIILGTYVLVLKGSYARFMAISFNSIISRSECQFRID